MSEAPGSTIGFERRFNAALQAPDPAALREHLTAGLKPQPPNFRRIVALNSGPLLVDAAPLPELTPADVEALAAEGAVVVDGRDPSEWAAAHLPGSINATMVRAAVGSRAAAAIDPELPVVVAAGSDEDARAVARRLEAVGFRRVVGILGGGVEAWREAGLAVESLPSVGAAELAEQLRAGEVLLLDVRDPDEYAAGHLPGSLNVPYQELRDRPLDDLRAALNGSALAVACAAGNRSALAASLLRREGLEHVIHVADGVETLLGAEATR